MSRFLTKIVYEKTLPKIIDKEISDIKSGSSTKYKSDSEKNQALSELEKTKNIVSIKGDILKEYGSLPTETMEIIDSKISIESDKPKLENELKLTNEALNLLNTEISQKMIYYMIGAISLITVIILFKKFKK